MGHVTGGRVYGYDNVEIRSSVLDAYGRPKRDHVERQINEEQAAVVRRIFHLSAEGKGMISIARLLNDDGCPAPRNSVGRKISWSPSSVRSLLFRRLYLGEVIWNKTKKRNPWGIQQQRKRPERDWIKIPMPHLQIISEREWKAGQHARFQVSPDGIGQVWILRGQPVRQEQLQKRRTRPILWLHDALSSRPDRMFK